MAETLLRFILGGFIVAALPVVSRRLGPATAGVALLYPAVSFAGLLFLGRTEGMTAVARTSFAAVVALPTVLAFLLGVYFSARAGLSLPVALGLGTIGWFAAATPIALLNHRRTTP